MEIKWEPESESSSPSSDIDYEMGETFSASAAISSAIMLPNPRRGAIKLKIKMAKKRMNDSDEHSSFFSQRKRRRKGIPHRAPFK